MMYKSLIFILILIPVTELSAQSLCGNPRDMSHSVDDYFDKSPKVLDHLKLVEMAHFTAEVERLERGRTSGDSAFGDLDYTLRHFPNHPRALYAMSKLFLDPLKKPSNLSTYTGFQRTMECYFQRAIQINPTSSVTYMLNGIYLHKLKKYDEALKLYQKSEQLHANSAELNYNMGLLYFDMKNIQKSKEYAKKAYRLGYQLPGLRQKLSKQGVWP